MDFVNKLTGSDKNTQAQNQPQASSTSGGGGFMDKLNGMAGGGAQGEKKEDTLDKGNSLPTSSPPSLDLADM